MIVAPFVFAEHAAYQVEFVLCHLERLLHSLNRGALQVAAAILPQGGIELFLDAEIVHHETFLLARIYTVHTRYGLYERVLLYGLEAIHRVEAWHVKPGYPHIHDNGNLEIALDLLELLVELLAVFVSPEQVVHLFGVVLFTGYYHVDARHRLDLLSFLVGQRLAVHALFELRPFRAQPDYCLIEIPCYLPRGYDYHGFPLDSAALGDTLLVVADKILCDFVKQSGVIEYSICPCGFFL